MEALTLLDSKRLFALEDKIRVGRDAWKTAGEALIEIRDDRLFRAEHETFWDYCSKMWGWKKRNVNTIIESYELYKSLPEGGQNFAHSASQVRELAAVEPERREEVLQVAAEKAESESRPMTALDVKAAAVEVCEPGPDGEMYVDGPESPALAPAPAPQPDRKSDDTFCFCVPLEELTQRATGTGTPKQLRAFLLELTKCAHLIRVALKDR